MHIAYLVNQYPKVSHSFIRREIKGLEAAGVNVSRYSVRTCTQALVDHDDETELAKTHVVLSIGLVGLLGHFIRVLFLSPFKWTQCFLLLMRLYWVSDRSLFHHFAYMAEACVLLKWFTARGIDHVHTHFGTNPATVAMLCKVLGGPSYSFTVHGPEEFDKPSVLALSDKIARAAFVIAVSSFGQSQLYRWCTHEQWSKIHVVHCGVDRTFLTPAYLKPMPETPLFVCVGRLSEQKGHLLLLDAVRQLAATGKAFKLKLVGDGPLRSVIEGLVDQWALHDYIEITGWASSFEVSQHLLQARALVLPSFAEGLPVVIMEALALHRPVISTYVAGIPELLEEDVCGWLIPSGSATALANAMGKVLELPVETLQAMGQAGAHRVALEFDATKEARKLASLFTSHLNSRSDPSIIETGTFAKNLTTAGAKVN